MDNVLRNVSRETLDLLKAYEALLLKWTRRINLISRHCYGDVWNRHIVDSAQIYSYLPIGTCVDLGSGGGLPAVVCCILAKDRSPTQHFTLVESDQRKAEFLRSVRRELDLSYTIVNKRVEDAPNLQADVITARAFAPLARILELTQAIATKDTVYVLPKGKSVTTEILETGHEWSFTHTKHPSITDPNAALLVLKDVSRA